MLELNSWTRRMYY